ncbi:MAG: hypothetical protein CMF76_07875 [Maricaulis sp.]|uniref:DUF1134 domain-containing protein n=1 Tax=Maricaulis virginensis TaxID=144022 RepID=A0A9W6IQD9_9PROT|nr:DUF1134 domain-containing protein [Maricaulis virginensis]MAC38134.1 hypothetical protein [Oceanicaulis sp.]MAZ91869.1 hypothetical protein [Maricaulis sp.]GLK53196.1 hypothetical protein GCM10017621_27040 [Maricaulis virginensis]HCM49339.1 DUF1134 domain-containing protein [Microbacterium sp.]|tara:strand:+ start:386 stop:976 length:591 start_codon:yes stop_codon:yes gene_type:complete
MRALLTIAASLALGVAGTALAQDPEYGQPSQYSEPVDTYSQDELVDAVSDFFGVTAEAAASVLERVFSDLGRPVGYVAGEEVAGAVGVGLRYGEGYLTMKNGVREKVYWRGPSIGFDTGGNASRVFVLVYNLDDPDRLFQRYPGVEGSAYLIAGMGVNYQRADDVTLAPIRSGVGLRAGANVGYLAYSRRRAWLPF